MKGEIIDRALEIIRMFNSGPVTVRMIQDRFGISRNAATNWIAKVSIAMPIIEVGIDEDTGGRPGIIYGMMDSYE